MDFGANSSSLIPDRELIRTAASTWAIAYGAADPSRSEPSAQHGTGRLREYAMAFDSSAADYLRRLKGDEHQPGFPRPETRPPAEPATTGGSERRQSPRYKCAGRAQFRVQGSEVRTWGTLTDISQHGCYVELMSTFPVGANVDLELELNGIRADVKGEVRVSYPCLGIGIAFREISDENRMRLLQMLRSLSPTDHPETAAVSEAHSVSTSTPAALPIIVNAAAALQALADFFETRAQLTKEEFVRILRKSQGLDDFHDNRR
jgi:PilZ domain